MPKHTRSPVKARSLGWLLAFRVPEFWMPIISAKVEEDGRETYAQWLRHLVREQIKDKLTAIGRGEVDFSQGGVMVTHESMRDGAEVIDMKAGASEDPDENIARAFLNMPGKD